MSPYCDLGSAKIFQGDCRDVLPSLADNSIDSVVTDPPYHLTAGKKGGSGEASVNLESPYGRSRITTGFMGKKWDGGDVAFQPETWSKVLRVLKPGGHLLAFGGTRTYHRLVCAIEDAGFEIRDQIGWVFGSGFPKSHNLHGEWEGWGTALKPAWEPICVARKPIAGTVAENMGKWGTGAINIDGCRIETSDGLDGGRVSTITEGWDRPWKHDEVSVAACRARGLEAVKKAEQLGRWPANVIHDGSDEILAAFPDAPGQQGDLNGQSKDRKSKGIFGDMPAAKNHPARSDEGSAARFFYCAKAGQDDRNDGCEHLPDRPVGMLSNTSGQHITRRDGGAPGPTKNNHPTVKPTDLMRYLCRLVTPPGGTVLDPFSGSGSTGKAALYEGFNFIGIEGEEEYCAISEARMRFVVETDSPLLRLALA